MSDEVSDPTIDERSGESGGGGRSLASRIDSRGGRMATTALGGLLLAAGIRRRSLSGAAMAFGGGWLVARGLGGSDRPVRSVGTAVTGGDGETTIDIAEGPVSVDRSITVGAPADELAAYWRDPEQLSRLMGPFAEVTAAGENRHHWAVDPPRGPTLSWETEIVDDSAEMLRWQSIEGATIPMEGTVRFRPAPGDRGTTVSLELQFDPPGGDLASAVGRRLGIVPETVAEKALRRFKSLAETGEIPSLERNPSVRGSGDLV